MQYKKIVIQTALITVAFLAVFVLLVSILKNRDTHVTPPANNNLSSELNIRSEIITVSDYTYDGEKLGEVNNIVVHYVANPGSSAMANRNYFNSLAETKATAASAHFIVGLDGEIIQCVPLDCVSWANGNLESNRHSITIECCHPDESGKFSYKTYKSLILLINELLREYDLEKDSVIRHYDVTGKMCPLYYVQNEGEWEKLIEDLK